MAAKTCVVCGAEFEGAPRSKLCPKCREYRCPICGASIKLTGVKRTEFIKRGWVTCSSKCGYEMAARRGVSVNSPDKRPGLFEKTCVVCGAKFDGAANAKLCQGCRTQPCAVCGKDVVLSGAKVSKFLERGWVTCGGSSCRVEVTRRSLMAEYGVENPAQLDESRRKIRESVVERSTSHDMRAMSMKAHAPDAEAKRRATNIEMYGVPTQLQRPEVIEKSMAAARTDEAKKRRRDTVFERYGVNNAMLLGWSDRKGPSDVEVAFGNMLEERGIGYEREFFVGGKPYDVKIADSDVLIELNPWIWHNVTWDPFCKAGSLPRIKRHYHAQKTAIAAKFGYRCIHIFDWDDWEKVVGMVMPPSTSIPARACSIVRYDADEMRPIRGFLDDVHLQGSLKTMTCAYTVESDGEILSCMTFGKPRYNKRFDWELLRYCSKPGVAVIGGAERMLSHFRRDFDGSIVSYCDVAKFDGRVYQRLGFEKEEKGTPTSHWYNPKTGRHITDSLLRQRGADQLLGTRDGKGTDNKEIMVREGFVEIYDCGQARYAIR